MKKNLQNLSRRKVIAGLSGGATLVGAGCVQAQPVLGGQKSENTDPVVNTSIGVIRGRRVNAVNVFKGIRYGADTAHTRFQRAVKPEPFINIYNAYEFVQLLLSEINGFLKVKTVCF